MEYNYLHHLIYNLVILRKCLRRVDQREKVNQNFITDIDSLINRFFYYY